MPNFELTEVTKATEQGERWARPWCVLAPSDHGSVLNVVQGILSKSSHVKSWPSSSWGARRCVRALPAAVDRPAAPAFVEPHAWATRVLGPLADHLTEGGRPLHPCALPKCVLLRWRALRITTS
ncbi:unnamed protein product [Symbiodinium natans]|uniref:Uncharacterized protein n=1 Tax=Symbiodinium natans TaxID=878477 RepID=A0A812JDA1_9DINO|nr:unnamed protein product [Symbiodinium natans]